MQGDMHRALALSYHAEMGSLVGLAAFVANMTV